MKHDETALAIKNLLVKLAVEDKLPMDMTMLDETMFIPILEAENPIAFLDTSIRRKQKMIDNARQFLVTDSDQEIQEMIDLIEANPDENQEIDYVEGVEVWEKVHYSFTCKSFMFEITPPEFF